MTRVFCQSSPDAFDLAGLVRNATRHFSTELEIVSVSELPSRARSSHAPIGVAPSELTSIEFRTRLARAGVGSRRPQQSAPELPQAKVSRGQAGVSGAFHVLMRPSTTADWESARRAEERGRSAGMAGLAARCRHVLEIQPEAAADTATESSAAELLLCAILASVALGPVLPDDEGALYGVRGAMSRFEAEVGSSLLRP